MMHPWSMAGHMIVRGILTLAMAVAVGAGCSDAESISPAATHDLAEPWQAVPFDLDAPTLAAATGACRLQLKRRELPPLAVVDSRGANTVMVLFAEPLATANCVVVRDITGAFVMTSSDTGSRKAQAPVIGRELHRRNISRTIAAVGEATYVIGLAGPEIASVEIVTPSGGRLRASLEGGWFAAWWPGNSMVEWFKTRINGYDASGALISFSEGP
jgi:hypothetical protein